MTGTAVERERRAGDRRHLVDRRSPFGRRSGMDRRLAQRRSRQVRAEPDRRTQRDRRERERRMEEDRRAFSRRQGRRRRGTSAPYTAEQLAAIQESHASPNVRPKCPVCSGPFSLGPPRQRREDVLRTVECTSCGKTAVVKNSVTARVIVIAEKEVVRQVLRAALDTAGHEVLEAGDAGVGLWAYDQKPADAVFVDVLSPGGMDSGEFIRQLRKEHADARVIAISGRPSYGLRDPLAVATHLGAVASLRIPFSQLDVLDALDKARA